MQAQIYVASRGASSLNYCSTIEPIFSAIRLVCGATVTRSPAQLRKAVNGLDPVTTPATTNDVCPSSRMRFCDVFRVRELPREFPPTARPGQLT